MAFCVAKVVSILPRSVFKTPADTLCPRPTAITSSMSAMRCDGHLSFSPMQGFGLTQYGQNLVRSFYSHIAIRPCIEVAFGSGIPSKHSEGCCKVIASMDNVEQHTEKHSEK